MSDRMLYQRQKTNELPVKVLVSMEQKRKAKETSQQFSGHCGREGTLQHVVAQYW